MSLSSEASALSALGSAQAGLPGAVASIVDAYPLSPTQAGMLFHALKAGVASGVDVQQVSMTLHEALDAPAWQRAWQVAAARHAVLRTRFRWEGVDEPLQEVLAHADIPFECHDWRGLEPQEQRERLIERAIEERQTGFDLRQAPLMRLVVVQVGDAAWSVLWTFHHILLDGRSFDTVLREVFDVYEAAALGETAPLPPVVPYRRFVEAQIERDLEADEAYWRDHLRGIALPLPLGIDRPRAPAGPDPHVHGPSPGARQRRLDAALTQRLRELAARVDASLATVLHAAWALLLHRCGGADDIVVGTTRAGRQWLATQDPDAAVAGLFINTVPLRIQVRNEQSLLTWLGAIRREQLAMRPYEAAPLVRVQGWADVERTAPLFETLVVYDHESLGARLHRLGGTWEQRHFDYVGQTAYPLALAAYGDTECLLRLEYDRRRFTDGAIERLLSQLQTLLAGMADDPHASLAELPWLRPQEREALTQPPPGATAYAPGSLLHGGFEAAVARTPQAPALTGHDLQGRPVELSYAQLNERANRLALNLRARGVQPNQLVGVRLHRHAELVVALLAILKAGGAYLPLDPVYPADRVAFMLEDSGVRIVLTQTSLRDAPLAPGIELLCIDDALSPAFEDAPDPLPVNVPGDLAYVIYTSGSTGTPKGVRISHHNVCRLFQATQPWYGFDGRDVWTLFHSYAFDFSVWELWGALLHGGRLVVVAQETSRDAQAFLEMLVRERVTVLNQTPTAFRRLVDLVAQQDSVPLSLRYVIFGGEALDLAMLRPWFDRMGEHRPQLVNMYGITETTVHVTYRPIGKADVAAGAGSVIGEPIPDLRLYVLDSRLEPVPIGVAGELVVAGAGLSSGYLNRPELTAERFVRDPFVDDPAARMYRSGDLARRLEDGDIEYLGRIDQQVKIRGFRIELGEIQSQIARQPGVRQAAVIVREDVPGDKRLAAYLVVDGPTAGLEARLRDELRRVLPDYMLPAQWCVVDQLPLTANGKLDVRALPVPQGPTAAPVAHGVAMADGAAPDTAEARAPREAEKTLIGIWQSVLRRVDVGLDDHFFDLGGDSILSIQIVARSRQAGLEISLKDLYERPTIAQLADWLESNAMRDPRPVHEARHAAVEVRASALTPIQHWFFEQGFEDAHHWNQSFLFETPADLPPAVLSAAWWRLKRQHPVLGLRFARQADGRWMPRPDSVDDEPPLFGFDLAHLNADAQAAELAERCAEAQAGFDLARGPLARALYFSLGPDRPGRFLIAVHHLVVDGVSWRILMEDLDALVDAERQGQEAVLPPPTADMAQWAIALSRHAATLRCRRSLPHWQALMQASAWALPPSAPLVEADDGDVVHRVHLPADDTRTLLQNVPGRLGAPTLAALLLALLRALTTWTGQPRVVIDLEGHGRESFDGAPDVSRTVGWFTSLFPASFERPTGHDPARDLEHDLAAVQAQLEAVPERGLAFGVLRYLSADESVRQSLQGTHAPILFNYLGQFDAVLAGARHFRLARESTGPWRSPRAHRTHALEVIALVRDGCLEIEWHHHARQVACDAVQAVAQDMRRTLGEIIDAARAAGRATPARGGRQPVYPSAARMAAIAAATARGAPAGLPADLPDLELPALGPDATRAPAPPAASVAVLPPPPPPVFDRAPYALTPMQRLFFTMDAARPDLGLEQWQFRLQGPLQPQRLREALEAVIARHSVLRSSFGLDATDRPQQAVVDPAPLPWREEDWRGQPPAEQEALFAQRVREDAQQRMDLARPPLMRVLLVRVTEQTWHFLWTTHHLNLDGWSWPIVWGDVSRHYASLERGEALVTDAPIPYRDYVDWVERQAPASEAFWRAQLQDVTEPTPLRRTEDTSAAQQAAPSDGEWSQELPESVTSGVQALARRLRLTPGVLFNAAWALVLGHGAAADRVVFGAAFSGRPPELPGIESMVGPCVNNVPLVVRIDPQQPAEAWLAALQAQQLDLSLHQYAAPDQVQSWSAVPWHQRVFDSLVVFQNYQVDDAVRRLGLQVQSSLLEAPEATNYALTITVAMGAQWRIRWLYDPATLGLADIQQLAAELLTVLGLMASSPLRSVGEWLERLPPATRGAAAESRRRQGPRVLARTAADLPVEAPGSERERQLAALWCELFGVEQVPLDANFFDLGGHSLLLMRAHHLMQTRLGLQVPVVVLLQHASVRRLARFLETGAGQDAGFAAEVAMDRAQRQRQAMARQRRLWARRPIE